MLIELKPCQYIKCIKKNGLRHIGFWCCAIEQLKPCHLTASVYSCEIMQISDRSLKSLRSGIIQGGTELELQDRDRASKGGGMSIESGTNFTAVLCGGFVAAWILALCWYVSIMS